MKKQIALLLLLCLLPAGCVVSPAGESSTAATAATAPSTAPTAPSVASTEPSTVPTEPITEPTTVPTTAPTQPSTAPTEPTVDEALIRSITDPVVMEHYHLPDLSDYHFHVISGPRGHHAEYTLYIGKYMTRESYSVSLDTDLQIENIYGDYGEYAQYLPYVTPEMITAAEDSLKLQSAAYPEGGPISMSIDEEGYLILCMEIIHHYEPIIPDSGGCGIDHDHLFFSARICPKP